VASGFSSTVTITENYNSIKPNVGVSQSGRQSSARTNTINDLAGPAVWQKELDKWDVVYHIGRIQIISYNIGKWKTHHTFKSRSMEDYMYMHTVKGDDYEKLRAHDP
jgi:hypothetical protein